MNILYIAYSCSPYHGSEDKIGWNIPVECAKSNNVYVITKEEQRPYIEEYLKNNTAGNIRFCYVDIPSAYKKVFSGPVYSGRLNVWNRYALRVAKMICKQENIDIIHQITPVEFRSIGNYGTIQNVKFVCGPLGGGEYIPAGLRKYAKDHYAVEVVRMLMNWWHKGSLRITQKLKKVDYVLFANYETANYLKKICNTGLDDCVCTEIGINEEELCDTPKRPQKKCRFLVSGRLVYRKGHALLLDALKRIPGELDYECKIVGDGPVRESLEAICRENELLAKHVVFAGALPYQQMEQEYSEANVLIMPSLRETTGTVLLEAMAKGLPVVTIGKFGAAVLLDENSGWLYDGEDTDAYVENLKNALVECIRNPMEVGRRGSNAIKAAKNYTWERKMRRFQKTYTGLPISRKYEGI